MGKFDGVLIASDLDGTLYNREKKVSEETLKAIAYFRSEGGLFTISTGRPLAAFRLLLPSLPPLGPVLTSNGALIYDLEEDRRLHFGGLGEEGKEITSFVFKEFPDMGIAVFLEDEVHQIRYVFDMVDGKAKTYFVPDDVSITPEEIPYPWVNVLFTQEAEKLDELHGVLREKFPQYTYRYSSSDLLEVMPAWANKGIGVLKLAEMKGIIQEHIYCIGDYGNDIDMLKISKVAFAPENAQPEILEMADVVVPDCDRHAVAAMIEHLDKIY